MFSNNSKTKFIQNIILKNILFLMNYSPQSLLEFYFLSSYPFYPGSILPNSFQLFPIRQCLYSYSFLKSIFPLTDIFYTIWPVELSISVRHIVSKFTFIIRSVRESMLSKNSLIVFKRAFENLSVFVFYQSLTIK